MSQAPINNVNTDDEIDLGQLAAALKRRWPWIAAGTIAGGLAASLLTVISKPVWEGEFQIVLSQKQSEAGTTLASQAGSNPSLAILSGLRGAGGGSQLETEVKILKSPSVLRPVFEFVRNANERRGLEVSERRFADWITGSLSVELETGTSVLSIAYRDTDKALVLPVLLQISDAYQQYSGRERSESISNGLAYAKEQVAQFRQQAAASNRALDAFSIRYGISANGGAVSSAGIDVSKLLSSNTSAVSVGSVGRQGDALGQLAAINQELIRRKQQFTNRDPGVQALIRERDALRRYIEMTAGGSLALPGQQPASKEQAQELILKFQELERTAKRDTATLDSLETTLMSLQLEQARSSKPWELISKPTLLDKPVSPRPARNLALGLLAGLVAGSGAALVVDRRSGRIFSKDELLAGLQTPLLAALPIEQPRSWQDSLHLLAHHGLQGSSLAVLPMGDVSRPHCNGLIEGLKKAGVNKLELCRTPLEAEGFDQQLLLACAGSCKRQGLNKLIQELRLQQKTPLGLIWLENSASNG